MADGRSIYGSDRRELIEEGDMKRPISLPIAQSTSLYVDPVCGMKVDPATAAAEYDFNGTKYYFCAVRCKERFAADPESFLSGHGRSADLSVPPAVAGGHFHDASSAHDSHDHLKSQIPNPNSQIELGGPTGFAPATSAFTVRGFDS